MTSGLAHGCDTIRRGNLRFRSEPPGSIFDVTAEAEEGGASILVWEADTNAAEGKYSSSFARLQLVGSVRVSCMQGAVVLSAMSSLPLGRKTSEEGQRQIRERCLSRFNDALDSPAGAGFVRAPTPRGCFLDEER